MKKLLLVLSLFLIAHTATARKFYFSSSTGSDTYTATQAQSQSSPWRTLVNLHKFANGSYPFGAYPNRAAAGDTFLFKCNDVFDIGFGNSNDNFGVVKWWNGVSGYTAPTGTANAPIVFTSYGTGLKPNLLFPFPTSVIGKNRYVLNFKNVGYMYFDNLQFNDIRFAVNDKVTSAYTCSGFMIGESNASICNNIKVTNCNFSNTCYGIRSCARVIEISNNTFTNFKSCGDTIGINDIGADALQPSGYRYLIKNNLIQGSWAYANPSSSSQGKLGGGLETINDFDSSLIIYNTFLDNSGAMEFGQNAGTQYGPNDDTFAFNKFINNSVVSYVNVTGTFACTAKNLRFWNNVVIENGNSRQTGANFGQDVLGDGQSFTTWAFWPSYPLNPTVSNPTGWRPFQYGSDAGVTADTLYDIRNNVIWNTNGLVMKYNGRTKIKYRNNVYRLSGGSSLGAALDAGEIQTTNKIFVDTISSANPNNWDLHLQAGSPAINAGMYVGVSPDFGGLPTSNPPSIGIYNYISTNTVPTVVTSTPSSISTTSAFLGGTVSSTGGAAVYRRGFMYSLTAIADTFSGTKIIATGTGIGTYGSTVTGLSANTSYHVRAFALNSVGVAYGADVIFNTVPQTCTFTYGSWSTCNGTTQTRSYTASPTGCSGVPPTDSITRSCTIPCTSFTYGAWSTCSGNVQTRTYTALPANCTGTPPADSTSRACISSNVVLTVVSVVRATCTNKSNGAVTVAASGGTAPYYYSINSTTNYILGQTTFTGLKARSTNTVRVKDARGVIASQSVYVGSVSSRRCP